MARVTAAVQNMEPGTTIDVRDLSTIYRFWFGDDPASAEIDPERIQFWMFQNDDTDRLIREGFGHLLQPAARVNWKPAELTREEAMALVVLFDQFPRNMFRTTGEAYAYDHIARDLARQLIGSGWAGFTTSERFMLNLPFVHHEDEADQDFAVMLSAQRAVEASEAGKRSARGDLDQATRHRDVIRRFGRFPHRNAMLGRVSTPEEVEFLSTALRGRGF